jgi:hypothetical protein
MARWIDFARETLERLDGTGAAVTANNGEPV